MSEEMQRRGTESRRGSRSAWLAAVALLLVVAVSFGWSKHATSLHEANRQAADALALSRQRERLAAHQRDMAYRSLRSIIHDLHRRLGNDPRRNEIEQRLIEVARHELLQASRLSERSVDAELAQAMALDRLGDLCLQVERWKEAADHLQRALDLCRDVLRKSPGDIAGSIGLASTLCHLGDAALARPETAATAEGHFREALRVTESLLKSHADEVSLHRWQAVAADRLGDVYLGKRQFVSARDAFGQASRAAKAARAMQIDAEADRALAAIYLKLGTVGVELQDRQQAEQSFRDSFQLRRELADANPTSAAAIRDLAEVLKLFAQVAAQKSELVQAAEFADSHRQAVVKLRVLEPDDVGVQREEIAAHGASADLSLRLHRLPDAQALSRTAVALAENLVARRGATLDDHLTFLAARWQSITVHAASGHDADVESGLKSLREWIDTLPKRATAPTEQVATWQERLRSDFEKLEQRLRAASK
jgi:tetratricopeptide (TPR) repeat protein